MKQIPNTFTWHKKPIWHWPNRDEKLKQVNDWVRDADIAFKHIKKFDLAVQAGGACGVWPIYLSDHFKRVITCEPVKENAEALRRNIEGIVNISFLPCALADKKTVLKMRVDDVERNNSGAFYAGEDGQKTPAITIDSLNLKACGFMALDLEGFEGKALKGAEQTIIKYRPVVMIEEKRLPHLKVDEHLEARHYLESIGYKEVDRIHRDVVFKYD